MMRQIDNLKFKLYLATRPHRAKNKLAWAIAFALPERIVYFTAIRLASKMTKHDPFQASFGDVLNNYADGKDF